MDPNFQNIGQFLDRHLYIAAESELDLLIMSLSLCSRRENADKQSSSQLDREIPGVVQFG